MANARLTHMTIASPDTRRLARFYRATLGAELKDLEINGSALYRGTLAGLTVVICPTEMAGVEANRSRHQLRFEVADVPATVEQAVVTGGQIHTEVTQTGDRVTAVVTDPDNNTIEIWDSTSA